MAQYIGILISILAWIVFIAAFVRLKRRKDMARGSEAWKATEIFHSFLDPARKHGMEERQAGEDKEEEDGEAAPPE